MATVVLSVVGALSLLVSAVATDGAQLWISVAATGAGVVGAHIGSTEVVGQAHKSSVNAIQLELALQRWNSDPDRDSDAARHAWVEHSESLLADQTSG